jgi:anti-sigma-K factor RskA
MSGVSGSDHVVDLLPAYALDCLDEEDLVQVSEHLAQCADCRAELHSHQIVAPQLALAMPDVAPPDNLKARLMNRIEPERPAAVSQPRPTWRDELTHVIKRTSPVWGLAGLLIIMALAISNLWLWEQLGSRQTTAQPGTLRTIVITSPRPASQATGLIVVSANGAHGTLVVDSLPPLDLGHQYQLWLIRDGEKTSGAIFSVGPDGYGSLWVSSPRPLSSYTSFSVTVEPAGGSPAPTGQRVLN